MIIMKKIPVSYENYTYDVIITEGFESIKEKIDECNLNGKKVMIVTDTNVAPLYESAVSDILSQSGMHSYSVVLDSGEEHKNISSIETILKALTENDFNRTDIVAALGGGVIGDMAGFASAIYKRGIDFIQIPTTLLAMVDSSVGGKTGIDFDGYKNMVGAFHNPLFVYMNTKTLDTLDERQFYNGFAESMKSAIIADAGYYSWLIDMMYEISEKESATIEELIERSVMIKKSIVEADFKETSGKRALLNLGHTIGHAIEEDKVGVLLHGECVALGTIAAAFISWKKQLLEMDEYYEIRDMFVPFNLPITVDSIDKEHIIDNIKKDKKQGCDGLKFILLKSIGKAVVNSEVTDDEIMNALKEIEYTDEWE